MKAAAFALALATAACAPRLQEAGPMVQEPELVNGHVVLADGVRLPLRRWLPDGKAGAVVVALHGFTDYSAAFERPAERLVADGVAVYAYDQRGFGEAPQPGIWPGTERLVEDLWQVAGLVRRAHPDAPLVLLGESMGAAVAAVAVARRPPEGVSGTVLVAPAVWGTRTMGPLLRGLIHVSAHTVPWLELPVGWHRRRASDNREMLEALDRDPLVLQSVRVDAIHGLVALMDEALAAAPALAVPTLVLFGAHERIVPERAREAFMEHLGDEHSVHIYPEGHHTLLRDLGADVVIDDVADWIGSFMREGDENWRQGSTRPPPCLSTDAPPDRALGGGEPALHARRD